MDGQDIHYESNTPLRRTDPKGLGEGEHVIWTSPEAVRISVEVRRGRVVRWKGRDRDGRPVKLSFRAAQGEEAAVLVEDVPFPQPPRPGVIVPRCYACFINPLPTGPRLLCYEVPCYDR